MSNNILPFTVYIEKFDNEEISNVSDNKWNTIRCGIVHAFIMEPIDVQHKLKDACEKTVYNGNHITFFTKDKFAQKFVILTINEKLKLPSIKAKGPRAGTKPNLIVKFLGVLHRMQPEIVLAKAISMHVDIECDSTHIQVRSMKKNEDGRSIACELPTKILDKVQQWAFDNKVIHFQLFSEWLRFGSLSH